MAWKRHENAYTMSRSPSKQCGDAECPVQVITRTQAGKQARTWEAAGAQEEVERGEEERVSYLAEEEEER